jgi:hypothetical protein
MLVAMLRAPQTTIVVVLLFAASVAAQRIPGGEGPLPNVGPPLILRLDGVVTDSREGASGKGFAVVSFAFARSETRRWFAVKDARTIGGDNYLDGKDVLNILAPFDSNLQVVGPAELVGKVRDAPVGTALRIEGLVDTGGRTYLVRSVAPPPG